MKGIVEMKVMAAMKRFLVTLTTSILILGGNQLAQAQSIADFTAFPPFLPRVVSPNILFLLDYSSSMVRPAYGECNDLLGNCRTVFPNMADDYSSTIPYAGYFDINLGDPPVTSYSDARAARYTCSPNGTCVKDVNGVFNGNWLNWLTMTQFDILKKVVIGGDITPAPEGPSPSNMKLQSRLQGGKSIYKVVTQSNCTGKAAAALCSSNTPQTFDNFQWVETAAANSGSLQTLTQANFTKVSDNVSFTAGDEGIASVDLPIPFTFYGNTYSPDADHIDKIHIHTDGILGFDKDSLDRQAFNYTNATINAEVKNIIAPLWTDLDLFKGGSVKYFTVGNQPNRVFVVTFDSVIHYSDTGKGDPLTFQALLFEGSNQIVFQYKKVSRTSSGGTEPLFLFGKLANIGVENSDGTAAKIYSFNGKAQPTKNPFNGTDLPETTNPALVSDGLAIFQTPAAIVLDIKPQTGTTTFQPAAPLSIATGPSRNDYPVHISLSAGTNWGANEECTQPADLRSGGSYPNGNLAKCYDHETTGLFHEFRDSEANGSLGFRIAFMRLGVVGAGNNKQDGGEIKTKGKYFNTKDTSSLFTSTRSDPPTDETPLAESLHEAVRYFSQQEPRWSGDYDNSNGTAAGSCSTTTGTNYDPYCFQSAKQKAPCVKSYALLVSSGNYSHDFGTNIVGTTNTENYAIPTTLPNTVWKAIPETPANPAEADGEWGNKANGGWLDNVAYYARTTDLRGDMGGAQNLILYAVNTFGARSGDGAAILKRAARFGGFKNLDTDNPNSPPTYFEATGGSDLRSEILKAVQDILRNSASGTSVSVLSTSAGGEGALYQAYFYPAKIEGSEGEDRRWPGFLRAFFLDRYQNLRDDYSSNSPDRRLVLAQDRIVGMKLNPDTNEVEVDLFADSDGDGAIAAGAEPSATVTMDNVVSLWEGGKQLAFQNKDQRRIYLWIDTNADGLVNDSDWSSTSGESRLLANWPATTLQPYLRAGATSHYDALSDTTTLLKDAVTEAGEIKNFVQGNHVGGYRNRCLSVAPPPTYSGEGAPDNQDESVCQANAQNTRGRLWPLGDIVFSTPTLVAAPGEKYDLIYSESSYRAFTQAYRNRRNIVYVGANDGMLHAFNAGNFNEQNTSFSPNPTSGNGWTPAPKLGDELWAFIPYDNLPHLPWLTCSGKMYDPLNLSDTEFNPAVCGNDEYTHVYYVDHRPKATDVRIFNDTATGVTGLIDGQPGVAHPNGWGTILIVPMRLGGGAITVTAGFGTPRTFRSAYYAFDITSPEAPPKLLWRFTDDALGFTTSYPAIARIKKETDEKWYMVVGSGPRNDTGARSNRDYDHLATTQNGWIFVVDLADGSVDKTYVTPTANTIMGDPTVVDVDLNFVSDVIYIGSSVSNTSGRVYRIRTGGELAENWPALTTLFDVDPTIDKTNPDPDVNEEMGPLLVSPSVSKDISGNLWVFFGSGRLRSQNDQGNDQLQRFYGIKDKCWQSTTATGCPTGSTYRKADLFDASNVTVGLIGPLTSAADQVSGSTAACGGDTPCTFGTMLTNARARAGWFVNLDKPGGPSERVLARSSVLGGLVLFTTYQPAEELCSVLGDSRIYALYYETGTAYLKPVFKGDDATSLTGNEGRSGPGDGKEKINRSISLGLGMPTSVGVAIGETVSGFVQKSTGEIIRVEAQPGLGVRSGVSSWRETTEGGGTIGVETIYKHIVK